MDALRDRLAKAGYSRRFVNEVVLPDWWSDDIEESEGLFEEAAATLCVRLGFTMSSGLDASAELTRNGLADVRFKKRASTDHDALDIAAHIARSVARHVSFATRDEFPLRSVPAAVALRDELLQSADQPWLELRDVVRACWNLGVPVIQINALPRSAKRPDALVTMIGDRPVIAVLSGRRSPSWVAFYIAHELGHIFHGHLEPGQTLVDAKIGEQGERRDEEAEANAFAAALLTGFSNLGLASTYRLDGATLASESRRFGRDYRVAPGVVALNYAFNTGAWGAASAALNALEQHVDAGEMISQELLARLPDDSMSFDQREWVDRVIASAR